MEQNKPACWTPVGPTKDTLSDANQIKKKL